jgi:hypothetical protein
MKSVVEFEIDAPRADVAELFADPRRNPEWMDDVARIEPVGGVPGEPGSSYRLVPKHGNRIFVATVVARNLPEELRLSLDSPTASVAVDSRLLALSERETKLISEETFTFKGALGTMLGFLGRRAIKRAHRGHMEAFKRFVEARVATAPGAPAGAY